MNRVVSTLVLLFCILSVSVEAQNPKFSGWGKNYTTISSYTGKTESAAFRVRIEKTGALSIEPGWKISVRAYPQPSSNGKIFPVEKLSMGPYFISGTSNDPGPLPSIAQIGINPVTYMQNNAEAFLIPSSPYHIYNKGTYNSYFDLLLQLNFIISGGSYLDELKHQYSSPEYPVRFEFKLYDKNNILMGTFDVNHTIQVSNSLSGTPPVENDYSLFLSPDAKDVNIAFAEAKDYIYGKVVSIPEGLRVSSTIDYELKVSSQSLTEYFTSSDSNEPPLPLDVVTVELGGFDAVPISSSPQKLAEGEQTNNGDRRYNIIYRTKPGDERLFNAKEEKYTTTLTYQIVPD